MKELDWNLAEEHLKEIESAISELMNTPGVDMRFYAGVFITLKRRYEKGERTEELYADIMDLE